VGLLEGGLRSPILSINTGRREIVVRPIYLYTPSETISSTKLEIQ